MGTKKVFMQRFIDYWYTFKGKNFYVQLDPLGHGIISPFLVFGHHAWLHTQANFPTQNAPKKPGKDHQKTQTIKTRNNNTASQMHIVETDGVETHSNEHIHALGMS